MQSNHYNDFLMPELQKHGYTAVYKKKTTEIYTGSAYAIDGCATFFKRDRFALVKKYEVRSTLYYSFLIWIEQTQTRMLGHGLFNLKSWYLLGSSWLCKFPLGPSKTSICKCLGGVQ